MHEPFRQSRQSDKRRGPEKSKRIAITYFERLGDGSSDCDGPFRRIQCRLRLTSGILIVQVTSFPIPKMSGGGDVATLEDPDCGAEADDRERKQ